MSFGIGNVTLKSNYVALYQNETYFDNAADSAVIKGFDADTTVGNLDALIAGTPGTNVVKGGITYAEATVTTQGSETTKLDKAILKEKGIIGVQLKPSDAIASGASIGAVTSVLEALQGDLNTARVEAGSQYAAIESAINYTTDLTAQYELGYNTVNDVNFSMETAHLAKNQILQQAATAMLSQANQGQQGLLQLLQG